MQGVVVRLQPKIDAQVPTGTLLHEVVPLHVPDELYQTHVGLLPQETASPL